MNCFFCKKTFPYYQPLDTSRKRFMRKVYPNFGETSYLCLNCFEKFEVVYQKKKRAKSNVSDVSIPTNTTSGTVASRTSPVSSHRSSTDNPNRSTKENTQNNGRNVIEYFSHSFTSLSNASIDSTDRLVEMRTDNPSLNDSSRITRNPEVVIAEEGARRAVLSVLRRKRARENTNSPTQTPAGRRRTYLHIVGDDDESETPTISSSNLAFVQPIVKRRREPVVHLNQDVMDIYLANTSGG